MQTPHLIAVPDETSPLTRKIGYFIGPALFLMTFLLAAPAGMENHAWKICGLAMWMATWWITEAMPLPVTSILPMIIIPLCGINSFKNALAPYSSPIIYLIFGGFVISLAMQKCHLHVRIGLGILKVIGIGPKSVLAGVMIATAFMGMWISNTATAIMMLPMAMSMANLLSNDASEANAKHNYFAKALVLGVVYSCVIGGLSSFIGAPTNAILVGFMAEHYGKVMTLADWMSFGVPVMIVLLGLTWGMLTLIFLGKADIKHNVGEVVGEAFKKLGPVTKEERLVTIIFLLTASLWIFSEPLGSLFKTKIDDALIAVFGAMLLFLVPTTKTLDSFALTWKDTTKLPWGILVFFGGSMSLSDSLTDTGVTTWLSLQLGALSGLNIGLIVLIVTFLLIAVSELMNNVATITAFLPILAAMAGAMHIDPLIIMIPATFGASCAFMLPGASAPNALAFGTGYIRVSDMIKPGFILDIISLIGITICTFTLVSWIYHIPLSGIAH